MKKRYLNGKRIPDVPTLILTGCFGDDSGDKKIGAGEEVITATKIVYSADHGGTTDESFVYFSFKNGELAATAPPPTTGTSGSGLLVIFTATAAPPRLISLQADRG